MRPIFIAGNWKLNPPTLAEARQLAVDLKVQLPSGSGVEVAVCPPAAFLAPVVEAVSGSSIKVGSQDSSPHASGAYTGELSTNMVKSLGCAYAVIGHSERRQYHGETNQSVNQKTVAALASGLVPIVCVGETLAEREDSVTFAVVEQQLREGLKGLSDSVKTGAELVIAYEPVWAIGTGKVATPAQAQEVHAFIRQILASIFNSAIADRLVIQYGGSVKADNAEELLSQTDIDGALVGGASLKADSFVGIITAANAVAVSA